VALRLCEMSAPSPLSRQDAKTLSIFAEPEAPGTASCLPAARRAGAFCGRVSRETVSSLLSVATLRNMRVVCM